MEKRSAAGLYIPTKEKRITFHFRGGGRVTVEAEDVKVDVDVEGNRVRNVEFVNCKSEFPFFAYDAVQLVEVVE